MRGHSTGHTMLLLAVLLATRAAAEWVEISQQHYRKPVRVTTTQDGTTRSSVPIAQPTKHNTNLEVLHTPTRVLNQNVMRNNYQGELQEPTRSSHIIRDVFLQKPMSDVFVTRSEPISPTRNTYFDKAVFDKPVRINPFLQKDVSLQNPTVNNFDQEVSQSPTRHFYLNKRIESTTEASYYPNHSITQNNWNQNLHGGPENWREGTKATTTPSFDNWNGNTYKLNSEKNYESDEIIKLKVEGDDSNIVRIKDEMLSGKVERVPNIGSVKRVQLANTPVKSPALNTKISENTQNTRNNGNFSDEFDLETSIFHSHEPEVPKMLQDMAHGKTKIANRETLSPISTVEKYRTTNKLDDSADKVAKVVQGISRFKENSLPENTAPAVKHKEVNKLSSAISQGTPQQEVDTYDDTIPPDFINTKNNKKTDTAKGKLKTNIGSEESRNKDGDFENIHNRHEKESSSENGEKVYPSSGELKVNTMENILKFMKVVADTISKNTRKGTNGKITYLNELKHTLLTNIKERIDATWPDDGTSAAGRRHSRSASPRGHVEFPSSESALMTISFLTFAVFLIKLVLQVIQTYKHKTMVMAPLMVASAGRAIHNKLRTN